MTPRSPAVAAHFSSLSTTGTVMGVSFATGPDGETFLFSENDLE